jgi:hypothetical protein
VHERSLHPKPGSPRAERARARRDANGRIEKERSYELILLYPVAGAGASDRKIEEIRRAYEKAFAQEAVGRVDDRTRADF